jgi:ABC-type transport system involved in multi-copper enzyme maturation permease subunit
MFTGSLALLHRALRLDARLLMTHLFRVSFAIAIYFCLLYVQIILGLKLGAPGLKLFETLSFLNLGLITLAGVSFFATAISEEKEEETLGLLKMAGLNPIGILLGKSTSRLLGAILLLLVQFPFTLLAITLGGVTLLQVISAYFSLTAYMILLANVGLFSSVTSRRGSNASSMTVLFLIVYFSCGWVLQTIRLGLVNGGVIDPRGGLASLIGNLAEMAAEASVYTRLSDIMRTGFFGSPVGFQVSSNVGFAIVSFLLAWAGFNHFTRDWRSTASESSARSLRWGTSRVARRRPKKDPVMWKEFHFITGGWRSFWGRFVAYGALTMAIFWASDRYYSYSLVEASQGVAFVMLGVLVLESSLYVSRIFHDEWRDRTLPLLMMLPIATPRLVYSKVVGCLPALLPAIVWLALGCAIMPNGLEEVFKTLVLPSRWFVALILLLFLTLTAFFSLVVKWGALPLALAVMLTGAMFGGCCFTPVLGILASVGGQNQGMEGAFLCVDMVVALLIAGLQYDIHRRLEIVASQ